MTCVFPRCGIPATTRNRAAQDTCGLHEPVVVGMTVDDGTHDDITEDQ